MKTVLFYIKALFLVTTLFLSLACSGGGGGDYYEMPNPKDEYALVEPGFEDFGSGGATTIVVTDDGSGGMTVVVEDNTGGTDAGTGGATGTNTGGTTSDTGGTGGVTAQCQPKTCESIAKELSGDAYYDPDFSTPVACGIIDEPDGCGGTITCDPFPALNIDDPGDFGYDGSFFNYKPIDMCGGTGFFSQNNINYEYDWHEEFAIPNILPRCLKYNHFQVYCNDEYPEEWICAMNRTGPPSGSDDRYNSLYKWYDNEEYLKDEFEELFFRSPEGKKCIDKGLQMFCCK